MRNGRFVITTHMKIFAQQNYFITSFSPAFKGKLVADCIYEGVAKTVFSSSGKLAFSKISQNTGYIVWYLSCAILQNLFKLQVILRKLFCKSLQANQAW